MSPSGERDLAALLANMQPRLDERAYVFRTATDERAVAELMPHARCVFREDEGVTLILDDAHAAVAPNEPRWARITLTVHSDLAAAGFLAAIATRLAAAGIAVNAVSAFYHDHLFVPWNRRADAMRVLHGLVRGG